MSPALVGRVKNSSNATENSPEPLTSDTKPAIGLIAVAAGILCDASGRILIAERKDDKAFPGLWEFPGGKLAAGESAEAALCRELDEELGIATLQCRLFWQLEHVYPDRAVSIDFFIVKSWYGVPKGKLGQRLMWRRPVNIDANLLLTADAPVLRALVDGKPVRKDQRNEVNKH